MQTGTAQPGPTSSSQIHQEHRDPELGGGITHLRGRAGVDGVLRRAQGRRFSLETAAVLGLAELPAKHNRGLVTSRARGTGGTAHLGAKSLPRAQTLLEGAIKELVQARISDKSWEGETTTGKYH